MHSPQPPKLPSGFYALRGNAALALAKRGYRIFPLIPGAKTPAIAKWREHATSDSATIIKWWSERGYNIGVACGESADGWYLTVLDYDMKDGQQGQQALDHHEFLEVIPTATVKTPNGVHKYYKSRKPIRNSQSRVAPNVDVRGVGGYVVGVGSVIEGVEYRWLDESPAAELPDNIELLAIGASDQPATGPNTHNKQPIGDLDQPDAIQRAVDYLKDKDGAPEAVQGSHGDATTFEVACRLKDFGLSEHEALEQMLANWNDEKAHPPWAFDALRTKVSNAYQYGRNAPGSARALNEFPVENSGSIRPQSAQQETIPLQSAFPIDPATIPPRDWIVPGLLLKKNITLLVAPPGSGKSLLTLQIAIMVATGMSWGGWNPRKQCKVLVINSEDDIDEMRRRLFATAKEMGVDHQALAGRVFLAEAPESIVIAAVKSSTRTIVKTPLVEKLVKTIKDNEIGCVVVDPFAETFEGDENSNSEVKWAGVLWREVSRRTDSALALVHHSRKYADDMAGEADVTRGGGSLIGVARILCTLFTMTETEARAMGVPVDRRTDYVRFDDAKANHSKRGAVRWFVKKTIALGNARGTVPGDEVGALAPWKPDLMEGITEAVLADLIETINAGILTEHLKPSGSFFTASAVGRNNDRWVGTAIMKALGCEEGRAKAILKDWTAKGWIEVFEYVDPGQRKPRFGVRCNAANWPKKEGENG